MSSFASVGGHAQEMWVQAGCGLMSEATGSRCCSASECLPFLCWQPALAAGDMQLSWEMLCHVRILTRFPVGRRVTQPHLERVTNKQTSPETSGLVGSLEIYTQCTINRTGRLLIIISGKLDFASVCELVQKCLKNLPRQPFMTSEKGGIQHFCN